MTLGIIHLTYLLLCAVGVLRMKRFEDPLSYLALALAWIPILLVALYEGYSYDAIITSLNILMIWLSGYKSIYNAELDAKIAELKTKLEQKLEALTREE